MRWKSLVLTLLLTLLPAAALLVLLWERWTSPSLAILLPLPGLLTGIALWRVTARRLPALLFHIASVAAGCVWAILLTQEAAGLACLWAAVQVHVIALLAPIAGTHDKAAGICAFAAIPIALLTAILLGLRAAGALLV